MRKLQVCLALSLVLAAAVMVWWFGSPFLPALPPVPQLRNAPGDAFALGVIGHTNDALGRQYVSFFFANPKEEVAFLTPTATERYDATKGQWTSVPYEPQNPLKIAPGSTLGFYLPRPEGDQPWRVVLTYFSRKGFVESLLETNAPGNRLEFRTPALIGVNMAPREPDPAL